MDIIKNQEIITKLMEKFKTDFGGYKEQHGDFYLRGVIDALWEYEQEMKKYDVEKSL
jgi:hypothetical protein